MKDEALREDMRVYKKLHVKMSSKKDQEIVNKRRIERIG